MAANDRAFMAFHQQTSSYNVRRPYGKRAAHEVDQWSGQQRNAPTFQMTIGLRTHISPHEMVKPWTPVYSQGSVVKPIEQHAAVLTADTTTRHEVMQTPSRQRSVDAARSTFQRRQRRTGKRVSRRDGSGSGRKMEFLSARRCRTCGAVRGGAGRALGTGRVTRQKHATRRRRRTMDDRATDRRRIQPRSVSRINLSTGAAAPLHQRRVTTVYTDLPTSTVQPRPSRY